MDTKLSQSEKTHLIKSLDRTLLVAGKARSVDYELYFQIITLRDNPQIITSEFQDLLSLIRTIPAFDIFNQLNNSLLGINSDTFFILNSLAYLSVNK